MENGRSEPRGGALRPFVETVRAGEPVSHLNLTLVPLRGGGGRRLDYIMAAEAIAAGTLTITEVGESGTVPELLAVNEGEQNVLLLDGEELLGAKQNRILNTTVMLPGRSKTRIPVSCVERGRWRQVSRQFSTGSHSPSDLRRRKSRDVSRSYRHVGSARSDQAAVWCDVARIVHHSDTLSDTEAMHHVVEQRRDVIGPYLEALRYPEGACGVVVALHGRFVAMDLFDRASTLQQIWQRLVTGYTMDAIIDRPEERADRPFTANGASALLERLAEIECSAFGSVGLGRDWRFEAPDTLGQALIADGACIHLSAFPNDRGDPDEGRRPGILSPSLRRSSRPRAGSSGQAAPEAEPSKGEDA